MKIVEIEDERDFLGLRAAWDALLPASASQTVFSTWEWAAAWWEAYGVPGELRILAAYDEEGRLQGLAPLRKGRLQRYGQAVPALSFIGDGSGDSDYLDFVIARGQEAAVMDAFRRHWAGDLQSGTVLALNEIPESSVALPLLRDQGGAAHHLWNELSLPCGIVHLPESWEEYLGMLKPRFRTKVRSVLRNLEGRPEVRFGFCRSAADLSRLLPALFDLHTKRWAQEDKPGVFGWDRKRKFYEDVSSHLLERDRLRLSWLEWNGRALACQYGFIYGDTYFHLQEGYEPASDHWSVGLGLRAWSIREFIRQGIRTYDFLGGVGRHKLDWGAEAKHSLNVLLASASIKNRLLCNGPDWERAARERVKALLPEKFLAARQAWRPQSGGGADRLRQAAAKCYFHLRLPSLTRRFREQYQVAISSSGSGRSLACQRRAAASGRILYYHRVNDDGDPFYPATPTRVFEEEIRFVAKHYRVVSLTELENHLDRNSPEPVVAITFDDGYQDNYHNALPILRRYNLPATIFLATGSLDSRQPLWFEQISGAFKRTESECIELDIDIPRRLWTRSVAERLEANSQVFGLLRGLADAERRQWVPAILDRLSAPPDREQWGKMLTWDQVREMKSCGIDFGGHTVNHPFVSRLTRSQAEWEVSECKRRIEEELQQPVVHFAYPHGREQDFAEWSKDVLTAAGYRTAVTTIWGLNYQSTDRLELRRGQPWEDDEALFAYKLDWYQLTNS